MLELLGIIIIISLTCIGITVATQEGYLLHPIRKYLEGIFVQYDGTYHWMYAPLLGCLTCMSSFWSLTLYILLLGVSWDMVIELLVIIPSVAALNTILGGQTE